MIHKQMISFMLIQISFNKKILIKEKYSTFHVVIEINIVLGLLVIEVC